MLAFMLTQFYYTRQAVSHASECIYSCIIHQRKLSSPLWPDFLVPDGSLGHLITNHLQDKQPFIYLLSERIISHLLPDKFPKPFLLSLRYSLCFAVLGT